MFPLEVRTVGPDEAYLSPNYGTATTVISVSGMPGTDYWDYLRSVDSLLREFSARVHWGKLHFLEPERLESCIPKPTSSSGSGASSTPRACSSTITCARCSPDPNRVQIALLVQDAER